MSFFKKLFTTDPVAVLDKADTALGRGAPVDALALLAKLGDGLDAALRSRRDDLEARARGSLVSAALERAAGYEEAGMAEQAADSLGIALEHCRDDAQRAAIERRLEALHPGAALPASGRRSAVPDDLGDDDQGDTDDDEQPYEDDDDAAYARLVAMLSEEVAALYEDRPADFRRAYVQLNEGLAEDALPVMEELVRRAPDDPVGHLERGRCLLLLGRPVEARADLEAAWEAFGDEPLDAPGALLVPLLWAEAVSELGDHAAIVARVTELAAPERRQAALAQVLATSLLALGRADEAREHLELCVPAFPREPVFAHLLASVVAASGEREEAIATLERAIAPYCASGGCGTGPVHVPSLRLLATLHLDEEDERRDDDGAAALRARDLVSLVAGGRGGHLEWIDHAILARCARQERDALGWEEELEAARALVPDDDEAARQALDALEARGDAGSGEAGATS